MVVAGGTVLGEIIELYPVPVSCTSNTVDDPRDDDGLLFDGFMICWWCQKHERCPPDLHLHEAGFVAEVAHRVRIGRVSATRRRSIWTLVVAQTRDDHRRSKARRSLGLAESSGTIHALYQIIIIIRHRPCRSLFLSFFLSFFLSGDSE